MLIMEEIWKDVEGYEDRYQVSNMGRIRNKSDMRILHQTNNHYGYKIVSLRKNGKTIPVIVHRIVAFAFCEGYCEGMIVNHKNEFKGDNRAENLEWCDSSSNTTYNEANLKGNWRSLRRPQFDGKRKEIGRLLKQIRKEQKLKVGDVALMTALSQSTVLTIENGSVPVNLDTLLSVLSAYGYTIKITKEI